MQNSEIFFENQSVRVEIDAAGAIWFCAKDVCDILGYENNRQTIAQHCWEVNVSNQYAHNSLGHMRETSFVNEPGLYQLIFGSTKPVALVFQKWVFEEVIPSIRCSGSYTASPERLASVPFLAEIQARMAQIEKDFAYVPGAELKKVHEGLRRDRSPLGKLLWSLGSLRVGNPAVTEVGRGFVPDDWQEMYKDMVEISKSDEIKKLVGSRLPNDGDDLVMICEEGFRSLQGDRTIVNQVF